MVCAQDALGVRVEQEPFELTQSGCDLQQVFGRNLFDDFPVLVEDLGDDTLGAVVDPDASSFPFYR